MSKELRLVKRGGDIAYVCLAVTESGLWSVSSRLVRPTVGEVLVGHNRRVYGEYAVAETAWYSSVIEFMYAGFARCPQ